MENNENSKRSLGFELEERMFLEVMKKYGDTPKGILTLVEIFQVLAARISVVYGDQVPIEMVNDAIKWSKETPTQRTKKLTIVN